MALHPHQPFNPVDPFDIIADLARKELAHAGILLCDHPEYKSATVRRDFDLGGAVLAGALTAVCGIVMSHYVETDEAHIYLRKMLAAYTPNAIDNARGILGLPPLPGATS